MGTSRPLNVTPMNPSRMACEHKILTKASSNDDEVWYLLSLTFLSSWGVSFVWGCARFDLISVQLHINTQSSSQWDGLRHYPYQETHLFYNGCTQDDISGPKANLRNGIQRMSPHHLSTPYPISPYLKHLLPPIDMARRGIAGRGVLLDWRRYALINKIPYSPFSFHAIPLADLKAVAAEQNVTFRPGDILIVRSGFAEEYNRFSAEERNALWKRSERNFVGVDSSEECIRWHWDMGFAAVAGDTVAYEAWPSPREWGVSLHEVGWVFYGSFLGLGLLMALFV
jgi:hypothetical protein